MGLNKKINPTVRHIIVTKPIQYCQNLTWNITDFIFLHYFENIFGMIDRDNDKVHVVQATISCSGVLLTNMGDIAEKEIN